MKKHKLAIVMRTDLGMTPGKMIAQGGHAVANCVIDAAITGGSDSFETWVQTGMKKVTLEVKSQQELDYTIGKAVRFNVPYFVIKDAGLTQVDPGTETCMAVGPASEQQMKKVIGHLSALP